MYVTPKRLKLFRVLTWITLCTSALAVLGFGFVVYELWMSPRHMAYCGKVFLGGEISCNLINEYGAHQLWLMEFRMYWALLLTNILDFIAAVLMMKRKSGSFGLYLFSFIIYCAALVWVGVVLPEGWIIQFGAIFIILLIYLTCITKEKIAENLPG